MNKFSPDVTIEHLTKFSTKDAASIRRLAAQLGPNFQPLNDNDLKEMLSSFSTNLFVIRESVENKIIGMVTLVLYRIPYLKKARLEDLIVDEMYRGQGLGSKILEKALAHAKEKEAAYVDFTSRPERVESNRLYEKFGFKKRSTNVYRLTF